MELTTAEKYLLVTERIDKKPMLRTRFTSQSYFVLAVFLDLLTQRVVQLKSGRVVFDESVQLPSYLSTFVKELTAALAEDDHLANALKPLTSWDIANQVYDGIGAELLADNQVQKVIFQNNLEPHVIYEPTKEARSAITTWVTQSSDAAALNLVIILQQMEALKWVVTDEKVRNDLLEKTRQQSADTAIQKIVVTAADVITQKRFWLDSWLS